VVSGDHAHLPDIGHRTSLKNGKNEN